MNNLSLEDDVLDNKFELLSEVISEITQIAISLNKEEKFLRRKDLVNVLNKKFPDLRLVDGLHVKNLVRESYLKADILPNIQESIKTSFLDNLAEDFLYDPERIFISNSNFSFNREVTFDRLSQNIQLLNKNIEKLEACNSIQVIGNNFNQVLNLKAESVFSITGSSKVESVYSHTQAIYFGYQDLIYSYENLKEDNLELISDFEFLRNELKYLREDILNIVIDIVGGKENLSPEIFDFSKVEWLEFEDTWNKLNFAFNSIESKFKIFQITHNGHMNDILKSGSKHVGKAFKNTSKIVDRTGMLTKRQVKTELAGAAIGFAVDAISSIAQSRKNAKETVALLNQDIEILKLNLKEDVQLILNDLVRLKKIYVYLKEVLIPSTQKFIYAVKEVFENKILPVSNEVFKSKSISDLRNENFKLIKEFRKNQLELIDLNECLQVANKDAQKFKNLIKDISPEYNYVLNIKPLPPNDFYSFVSLGLADKAYNKHIKDWDINTEPIRELYNYYEDSLGLENQLIDYNENKIKEKEQRNKLILEIQEANSKKLKNEILLLGVQENVKLELIEEVQYISKASKKVIEAGIEEFLNKDHVLVNLTEEDISFLNNKKLQMKLKTGFSQLITDAFVTGTLVDDISERLKKLVNINIPDEYISNELSQLNNQIANGIYDHSRDGLVKLIESKSEHIQVYLDSKKGDRIISEMDYDELSVSIKSSLMDLSNQFVNVTIDRKSEVVKNLIEDKKQQAREFLKSKMMENSVLNENQADKLINVGFEIFSSILEVHRINEKTNYLKYLNQKIDQQFLHQFEERIESLKVFVNQKRKDAILINSILNNPSEEVELMKVANLI